MPCCKAEEFENWCKDEPTFEYEGKEYCIFHAPAEAPEKQDVEVFNELVFKRIDECKERDEACDFRGVIFPGKVVFFYNDEKPLPNITFEGACFVGDADFKNVHFKGNANFDCVKFCKNAVFELVEFIDDATFNNARFCSDAIFSASVFQGFVDFDGTMFDRSAAFVYAEFEQFFGMQDCLVKENIEFTGASFNGNVMFTSVNINGETSFLQATFSQNVSFTDVRFGKASFHFAFFSMGVTFTLTEFISGDFSGCSSAMIEFDQADLTRVSFLNAPLERMRFIDCQWPKCKNRKVICDALRFEGRGQFKLNNVDDVASIDIGYPPPSRLADVFRRLKKIASDARDEPLASDWHYAEKEMQRRAAEKDNFLFYLGLTAYKWASKYGESPLRAFLTLIIITAFPFAINHFFNSNIYQGYLMTLSVELYAGEPVYVLITIAKYLQKVFATPILCLPVVGIPDVLSRGSIYSFSLFLYQTIVIVQAGLFGFATRNKMRR